MEGVFPKWDTSRALQNEKGSGMSHGSMQMSECILPVMVPPGKLLLSVAHAKLQVIDCIVQRSGITG